MNKVAGQPCPDCGEPFIEGKKGAYCKPCYIKWAEAKKNASPTAAAPQASGRDFAAETRGKVRHGLVVAMIGAGKAYADIAKALPAYMKLVLEDEKQEAAPPVIQQEEEIDVADIPF